MAVTPLGMGFDCLYNLDFAGAQKNFLSWQQQHPDDPVGPVTEVAGSLFSEFNWLGVIEAQFYENDEAFSDRPKLNPDPETKSFSGGDQSRRGLGAQAPCSGS